MTITGSVVWAGRVPVGYGHYLLSTLGSAFASESSEMVVTTSSDATWVDVRFHFGPVPRRRLSDEAGVGVSVARVEEEWGVRAWDGGVSEPDSPALLGAGEWRICIRKTFGGDDTLEVHDIYAEPLDELAKAWQDGGFTAPDVEPGAVPADLSSREWLTDLRPPAGDYRLVASQMPESLSREHELIRLEPHGLILTKIPKAVWTVWFDLAPYPLGKSWMLVASWRCSGHGFRVEGSGGKDIVDLPAFARVPSVQVTIASRNPRSTQDSRLIAAGMATIGDFTIFLHALGAQFSDVRE